MEAFIGTIQLFGFFFAPLNWASCEGQILKITDYQALFALIGNKYGGDGYTTFALPDLRGAEPLPNMKYYIALNGIFPPRS